MDARCPSARGKLEIADTCVLSPDALSDADKHALSRHLYKVHEQIFSGVSADQFYRHVVDPPAEKTLIRLFLARDRKTIGYCAVHTYWRQSGGRKALVLRAEAGLMPDYRGRGVTYTFGILRAIVEKLRHPFTPVYYLGTLVHTSSYHLLCKYFPRVYPHPTRHMPARLHDIALDLVESFPDPAVSPADPFIRDVGWRTIETAQEQALNERTDRRDVQFFKSRNPGYPDGHGLVVLVPITIGNVSAALFLRLYELSLIVLRKKAPHL